VDGNLKPLDFVDEKPERVAELAAALVRRFEIRGGFILSSGCEIPPEARPETIEAFVAAARSQEAHSCRY
jgi:uroporphyrinogen decarboxylase